MLKMIKCDQFRQKKIKFRNGLNSIVGDDIATNSIGKTNLLMIIDFIFGGNDYLEKNSDTVDNLGHHSFYFIFEFNNELFYFSRGTENPEKILTCNDSFVPLGKKDRLDYCNWLQKKYNCELEDLSFRDIVGRYFRIYGKQNLNEKKPIQYFDKEKKDLSILNLIKLFDKYKILKTKQEYLQELQSEKDALHNASKENVLMVTPNKTTYKKIDKEIKYLEQEIETIKKDVVNQTTDVGSLVTQEVIALQNQKGELIKSKLKIENKIKRASYNLSSHKSKIRTEMSDFIEYFPNVNLEKIEAIDEFHSKLSGILKDEIEATEKQLRKELIEIENEIANTDIKLVESLNIKPTSKLPLDVLINKSSEVQALRAQNDFFDTKTSLISNIKKTKKGYEELRTKITDDISSEVNSVMEILNSEIYPNGKRAPNFNIHGKSYTFNTYGDTGTGTAYANFITFDLAILKLTKLPSFIHDLPLIKNIENEALENILTLYNESNKQIFIAIDKLSSYSCVSQKIVENSKVIKLTKDNTLFIKNWKNE